MASSQRAPAERGVRRLEAPWDECREAAGLFLQFIKPLEMIDAVLELFADAEHHGGGRPHAELVSGAMHVEPVFSQTLQTRNFVANFIIENFSAAAGNGIEAGVPQARNRVAHVSPLYSAIARISDAE